MKVKFTVRDTTGASWTETIDNHDIKTLDQAERFCHNLVSSFNTVERRRYGAEASTRTLISCEIEGASQVPVPHTWVKRTDGMSVLFNGRHVDLMMCSHCHVTGKRFGLSGVVKRDSEFRAKKYEGCSREIR